MASGASGPPSKRLKQSLLSFTTTKTDRRSETVARSSESQSRVVESDVFEGQVDVQTSVGGHGGDAGHLSLATGSSNKPDARWVNVVYTTIVVKINSKLSL